LLPESDYLDITLVCNLSLMVFVVVDLLPQRLDNRQVRSENRMDGLILFTQL
jgi:hypothetical protein